MEKSQGLGRMDAFLCEGGHFIDVPRLGKSSGQLGSLPVLQNHNHTLEKQQQCSIIQTPASHTQLEMAKSRG